MSGISKKASAATAVALIAALGLGAGTSLASTNPDTDLGLTAPTMINNLIQNSCGSAWVSEQTRGYLWNDNLGGSGGSGESGKILESFVGTVKYAVVGKPRKTVTLSADFAASMAWSGGYEPWDYTDTFVGTGPYFSAYEVLPESGPSFSWVENATNSSPGTSVSICELLGLGASNTFTTPIPVNLEAPTRIDNEINGTCNGPITEEVKGTVWDGGLSNPDNTFTNLETFVGSVKYSTDKSLPGGPPEPHRTITFPADYEFSDNFNPGQFPEQHKPILIGSGPTGFPSDYPSVTGAPARPSNAPGTIYATGATTTSAGTYTDVCAALGEPRYGAAS